MTKEQRKIVVGTLWLFSVLLPLWFLRFETQSDFVPLLTFSKREGTVEGVGFTYMKYTGIYANPSYSDDKAIVGGIVIPILLLSAGAYLHFGRRAR